MSPKVIYKGAKRPSGGRVWEGGVSPPGTRACKKKKKKKKKKMHFEHEKNKSFWCIFWQRLLEYYFLQIPRAETITSSFEHAVSDAFILIISERAPLEITNISMSPKVICEGVKRPNGGRVWEGDIPGQGKLCIWTPKKQFPMHVFGAQITRMQTITVTSK